MSKSANELGAKAQIDFHCFDPECDGIVKFNLADIAGREFQAVCPKCHRAYELDAALKDKLGRMLELITAIRKAEDILGDSNVSVNVAGGGGEDTLCAAVDAPEYPDYAGGRRPQGGLPLVDRAFFPGYVPVRSASTVNSAGPGPVARRQRRGAGNLRRVQEPAFVFYEV